MRIRLGLVFLLFSSSATAIAQENVTASANTLMEQLLGDVWGEIESPQLYHRWVTEQFDRLDRTLSIKREAIEVFSVLVDGQPLVDSARGQIEEIVLDKFKYGPDRFEIHLRDSGRRWSGNRRIAAAKPLIVSFEDDEQNRLDCFYGIIIRGESRRSAARYVIHGYQPTAGGGDRRIQRFSDMGYSEIVESIAQERGLQSNVESTNERLSVVTQAETDLAFLNRLANTANYEWYLEDDVLQFRRSDFTRPVPSVVTNVWRNMTDSEIAEAIAGELGKEPNVDATERTHARIRQNDSHSNFLYARAMGADFEFYLNKDTLFFKKNGLPRPQALISKKFLNVRYSDIAVRIAAKHRLTPRVTPSPRRHRSIAQKNENDVEFLLRLAHTDNYWVRATRKELVFKPLEASTFQTADYLQRRIRILFTASKQYRERITTEYAKTLSVLANPEKVPLKHFVLNLSRASSRRASTKPKAKPGQAPKKTSTSLKSVDQQLQQAAGHLDRILSQHPDSNLSFKKYLFDLYGPSILYRIHSSPAATRQLNSIVNRLSSLAGAG